MGYRSQFGTLWSVYAHEWPFIAFRNGYLVAMFKTEEAALRWVDKYPEVVVMPTPTEEEV